jgi:transcriptional regulator with XRE-family HTH domain
VQQSATAIESGRLALVTDRRGYEVLAANLHRLAFERGLTLDDIARAVGISLEQLQAILTGEFDPELELVNRIGLAVGVTASELIADHEYN